jgi:fructose-specific phosphotransferase system IIA component
MLLTQILSKNCLKVPLQSKDKDSAIAELIDVLEANTLLTHKETAVNAVYEREQTRSTGIGSGIAIPHAKCSAVESIVMAIGIAPEPIDFDSIDGKPVNIIMLVISPQDNVSEHVQILASISRLMLDEKFRHDFARTQGPDQAYKLLYDKENNN